MPETCRIARLVIVIAAVTAPGLGGQAAEAARPAGQAQAVQQQAAAAAMAGFWEAIMEPEDERFRRLGPSGGPGLGEFTGLYFTAAGLARAQAWNPDDEYLPENLGKSQVVPTIMTTPFPIKFEFGPQSLTIRLTECDNVRTVALRAAPQPAAETAAAAGTAMGNSTGHWDGDSLVIRTTGIRPGYIRANGAPQSADAIATERYGVVGGYLLAMLTVEDPAYYTRPVTRVIAYRKRDDISELEQYGACS